MSKPTFCTCVNKGTDQLCSYCKADQRLYFRYMDSTTSILSESKISSVCISHVLCLYSSVCVKHVRKPNCWFLNYVLFTENHKILKSGQTQPVFVAIELCCLINWFEKTDFEIMVGFYFIMQPRLLETQCAMKLWSYVSMFSISVTDDLDKFSHTVLGCP